MSGMYGNIESVADFLKRLRHVLGYYIDDEATVEEASMEVVYVLACADESVLRGVVADCLDIPRPGWTYPASRHGEQWR